MVEPELPPLPPEEDDEPPVPPPPEEDDEPALPPLPVSPEPHPIRIAIARSERACFKAPA
jgi:hypothetical protein